MKRKYWRDLGFFAAGTFLGGWVLSFASGLFKKV
jgi:hypothetical protein